MSGHGRLSAFRNKIPSPLMARSAIKSASVLTNDPGVIEPARLEVLALTEQLRTTLEVIKRFDKAIAELFPTLPDHV